MVKRNDDAGTIPELPSGWPVNADGDPYPYEPIVDTVGQPAFGPTIADLVAQNAAREQRRSTLPRSTPAAPVAAND